MTGVAPGDCLTETSFGRHAVVCYIGGVLTRRDSRRRWWGTFFLVGSLSLLVWGQTALKGELAGETYLYYWLACMLLTFLAFVTALLDFWIIRRRARTERREMVKRLLENAAHLAASQAPAARKDED